jgi:carbonic anhydrase
LPTVKSARRERRYGASSTTTHTEGHMNRKSTLLALLLALPVAANAQVWNHNPGSDVGPNVWGTVTFPFATCGSVLPAACGTLPDPLGTFTEVGKKQSPIDIVTAKAVATPTLPALGFSYGATPFVVENTGHVIEVPYAAGAGSIQIGDDRYDLVQFHFHTTSEHTVNGVAQPMEVHLVHRNALTQDLAVVGVLLKVGNKPNQTIEKIFANAPLAEGAVTVGGTLTASSILPASAATSYWTYSGSLTTPPCSEGVRWVVAKDTVSVSSVTLAKFQQIVAAFPEYNGWFQNNRPVRPLGARSVQSR